MQNRYNLIFGLVQMLVNHHLILIQSKTKGISRYRFSRITYFFSYYRYPILSLYVMSWIGFWLPRINPIIYL